MLPAYRSEIRKKLKQVDKEKRKLIEKISKLQESDYVSIK